MSISNKCHRALSTFVQLLIPARLLLLHFSIFFPTYFELRHSPTTTPIQRTATNPCLVSIARSNRASYEESHPEHQKESASNVRTVTVSQHFTAFRYNVPTTPFIYFIGIGQLISILITTQHCKKDAGLEHWQQGIEFFTPTNVMQS